MGRWKRTSPSPSVAPLGSVEAGGEGGCSRRNEQAGVDAIAASLLRLSRLPTYSTTSSTTHWQPQAVAAWQAASGLHHTDLATLTASAPGRARSAIADLRHAHSGWQSLPVPRRQSLRHRLAIRGVRARQRAYDISCQWSPLDSPTARRTESRFTLVS